MHKLPADIYIPPNLKVHSNFEEAKTFFDEQGGGFVFLDLEAHVDIADLVQGRRNLIVGEPGVGKTELIAKVREQLRGNGFVTRLVNLRDRDSVGQIDVFLRSTGTNKALLLDALDEVQSSRFPLVLQKIADVSSNHPELIIYISSRWIFITKYAISFPDYRFITISPFTQSQVREYLSQAGHSPQDIDELLNRTMSFGHHTLVVQIPRYLSYLTRYLAEKGVKAARDVSRNDLFEYFIYSKLELEDRRLYTRKRLLIKRVLEKLALTMEIYQTNTLSKDELMTFLDELNSDLTLVALSQWKLELFYEKSLLKDGIETIEFDNTEFQEYLAAKEITRLPNISRAAFLFATDPNIRELCPTWFNALTFLVDMQPEILEQLIEYSGIRATEFKVLDSSFLEFLSRVNPSSFPQELRQRVFNDCMAYHVRTLQWIPAKLSAALPGYYDASLESGLKRIVEDAEARKAAQRFVPLANVANIVGNLWSHDVSIDASYWRERLLAYAVDDNEVVQRYALFALGESKDASVIDALPDLSKSEELVARAFLTMCVDLDPNHRSSVRYFIKGTKAEQFEGRYGIAAITSVSAIKAFFEAFVADSDFRQAFLNASSYSKREDAALVRHIGAVLDAEISELGKAAITQCADFLLGREMEESAFLVELWKLLQEREPAFVPEMVRRISGLPHGRGGFHFVAGLIAEVITKENVVRYIDAMIAVGEEFAAFDTLVRVKRSSRPDRNEIFEMGRNSLASQYSAWEVRQQQASAESRSREEELLKQFEAQLEPEPGKFSTAVFRFYKKNVQRLGTLLLDKHRARLIDLIENTVFKFVDPGSHVVTINDQGGGAKSYTMSSSVRMFGDALLITEGLGIDASPYRRRILDFIPFAFGDELKAIFRLVPDIKLDELLPVIEKYKTRSSDLWRHEPSNLVDAIEQYHVTDAIPVLRSFVREPAFSRHTRRKALTVAESLVPDAAFLEEVFSSYVGQAAASDESALAEGANALLITSHGRREAIRWRLEKVRTSAVEFIRPKGLHRVGDFEEELHSKSFAKPLLELRHPGFEREYLGLLDEAVRLWAKGEEFHAYATYLWDITYAYFENLKERGSYIPLQQVENKVAEIKDREGGNWLASRMASLRRSYLAYLGKPRNISAAVQIHNAARDFDDRKIRNSEELFRHLQNAIETDLTRWIEGEGAYDLIRGEKVYATKKQEYEKLIQKTIKAQIENIFLRRGFEVDIIREPQLFDEKRTDFLVRYGFVGPIVVEVKLASNTDLKARVIEKSPSYKSMRRYMSGYGASYGLFLIIDNDATTNISRVKGAFQQIPDVWVHSVKCRATIVGSDHAPKTKKSNARRGKGRAGQKG